MSDGKNLRSIRTAVVDDEAELRESMVEVLEHLGTQIIFQSSNAVDAMMHFRSQAVDVAFLDLGLPDFDGADMAKLLKASHPRVKLVATTGDTRPARHAEAKNAGFDQVVTKPLSESDVREILEGLF